MLLGTCGGDTAETTTIDSQETYPDVQANMTTAHFCSASQSVVARYAVDLPGGRKGRFKVVAIDPSDPDSTHIVQTGEVTFNGGVTPPFPIAILRVTTVHQSLQFEVHAIGLGFDRAESIDLKATDYSWDQSLAIQQRTDSTFTASADLAASVPDCLVEASSDSDYAYAPVAADLPPPDFSIAASDEGCETRMREVWPGRDPYLIQPKDFAFVAGGWTTPTAGWNASGNYLFHAFYIRHNQYLSNSNTEKHIGHAVSDTLSGWTIIDTSAIAVRPAAPA